MMFDDNLTWLRSMANAKVNTVKRERFEAAANELEQLRKTVAEYDSMHTGDSVVIDIHTD